MPGGSSERGRRLPEPTVARLPIYQRIVSEVLRAGETTISSERLGELAGVNAPKVRKDLSLLGSLGTRGTGYDAEALIRQIDATLGAELDWPVVISGIGNLGRALVNARGFLTRGYRLVGLVDVDPRIIGTEVGEHRVLSITELEASLDISPAIGVVATPARAAQDAADQLVRLGVRSVLNFAPRVLSLPAEVRVRYVDLSIELQVLSYHATHDADVQGSGLLSTVGIQPGGPSWSPAAESSTPSP